MNGETWMCLMMKSAKHRGKKSLFGPLILILIHSEGLPLLQKAVVSTNSKSLALLKLFLNMFAFIKTHQHHQLNFVFCIAPFQMFSLDVHPHSTCKLYMKFSLVFKINIKHISPSGFIRSFENTL